MMLDFLEALGHCFDLGSWFARKVFGIQEPSEPRPLTRAADIAFGVVVVIASMFIVVGLLGAILSRN
jgi:hypothetical protein